MKAGLDLSYIEVKYFLRKQAVRRNVVYSSVTVRGSDCFLETTYVISEQFFGGRKVLTLLGEIGTCHAEVDWVRVHWE